MCQTGPLVLMGRSLKRRAGRAAVVMEGIWALEMV
jgi:hypothetical protein